MRRPAPTRRSTAPALLALAALALLGALVVAPAQGERTQKGDLILRLGGGLSPLKLPRDRSAPVAIHLAGGLQTADGGLLPRVTKLELGLPGQGVLDTRGLALCPQRRLRNTKSEEALAACRSALVGHGRLRAQVFVPNQKPFPIRARLLAFNGRVDGRRAVLLHAAASNPPISVVLPFSVEAGSGRFGTALVGDLSRSLGPLPRFASFEMTLSRRYSYRGKRRSYLSASCPIPPRFTAGFFSFARANLTLAGGRRIGTGIARSCRTR